MDERGNFREDNFEKLHASFGLGEENGPGNNPKAAALKGATIPPPELLSSSFSSSDDEGP